MIIRSVEIISFGKFRNKTIEFSDGFNIISGNNESGKSTVISFIYAMLYGFGDNRGKGISLREKYTPWYGGVCEGKLHLKLSDGKNITVYRKAGEVRKFDILKVYDSDTAEPFNTLPEDIVGVSGETFLKTVCIKQLSTVFEGSSNELVTKLANIAKSGDESTDFEKAIRILDNIRREIRPQRGSGGALHALNEEISVLERKKASYSEIKSQLDISKSALAHTQEEFTKAEENYENALKKNYDALIENIRERIFEKEEHISLLPKKSHSVIYMCAFSLFLILSLVLFFTETKLWFMPLIASAVLFVLSLSERKNKESCAEQEKLNELKKSLSDLEVKKRIHEKKVSELKLIYEASGRKLSEIKERISSLESRLEYIDTSTLPFLYRKRSILEKNLSTLTLVTDSLENAHKKMQQDFTPQINKKAAEYISFLTDGKYERLFTDESFSLKVDADIPREAAYFSGGTVDQIYLSLRLALTDMLFKDEAMFIILDQPFIQYDSPRTEKALELLNIMSKNRQVLLFSSQTDEFSVNKNIELLT